MWQRRGWTSVWRRWNVHAMPYNSWVLLHARHTYGTAVKLHYMAHNDSQRGASAAMTYMCIFILEKFCALYICIICTKVYLSILPQPILICAHFGKQFTSIWFGHNCSRNGDFHVSQTRKSTVLNSDAQIYLYVLIFAQFCTMCVNLYFSSQLHNREASTHNLVGAHVVNS